MALWLSRTQKQKFLSEAKEFVAQMAKLDHEESAVKTAS